MSIKIYFEAQDEEFQLCGQHSLNNLLQGAYFTAWDLGDIGATLDRQEQDLYNKWTKTLHRVSNYSNVSPSGSFSIDVILAALNQLNLTALSLSHPQCASVLHHPEQEMGFIINNAGHWMSYRKVDDQWYNLDSITNYRFIDAQPIKISEFYLAAQLTKFYNNRYQIYVIRGEFPDHENGMNALRSEELKHEYKWHDVTDIATHPQLYTSSIEYAKQHRSALRKRMDKNYKFDKGFHIKWRITPLPPKKTKNILSAQGHQCASCNASLRSNFLSKKRYLYCEYTGTMHCTLCHRKEKAIIPFKVLNTLNYKQLNVCVSAKQFLDQMYYVPCITMCMFAVNKRIERNKQIQTLKQILFELKEIKQYGTDINCKELKVMMKESYIYDGLLSLHDVVNVLSSVTLIKLEMFSNKLQKHIMDECAICKLKKRYCSLCSRMDIIYPFKKRDVVYCNECSTYYHQQCWTGKCVKCEGNKA